MIFDEFLSGEERREWEELYSDSNEFITRYAIRSPEEDFCECYAKFVTDPERIEEIDGKKYSFIRKIDQRIRR